MPDTKLGVQQEALSSFEVTTAATTAHYVELTIKATAAHIPVYHRARARKARLRTLITNYNSLYLCKISTAALKPRL